MIPGGGEGGVARDNYDDADVSCPVVAGCSSQTSAVRGGS